MRNVGVFIVNFLILIEKLATLDTIWIGQDLIVVGNIDDQVIELDWIF